MARYALAAKEGDAGDRAAFDGMIRNAKYIVRLDMHGNQYNSARISFQQASTKYGWFDSSRLTEISLANQ